jgi:hypothetical protein
MSRAHSHAAIPICPGKFLGFYRQQQQISHNTIKVMKAAMKAPHNTLQLSLFSGLSCLQHTDGQHAQNTMNQKMKTTIKIIMMAINQAQHPFPHQEVPQPGCWTTTAGAPCCWATAGVLCCWAKAEYCVVVVSDAPSWAKPPDCNGPTFISLLSWGKKFGREKISGGGLGGVGNQKGEVGQAETVRGRERPGRRDTEIK